MNRGLHGLTRMGRDGLPCFEFAALFLFRISDFPQRGLGGTGRDVVTSIVNIGDFAFPSRDISRDRS